MATVGTLQTRLRQEVGSRLSVVVLLGATLLGVAVAAFSPVLVVAAICGLLWSAWLLSSWRWAALATVAVVVAVPRYAYSAGGLTVTAERVVLPIVGALLVLGVLGSRRAVLRLGWAHLGLAIFIAANAAGAVVNAPSALDSLRTTLLIAVASLPFWILPNLARDWRAVRYAFRLLVMLGTLEAGFGMLASVVYAATGVNLAMQIDPLTKAAVPYGSQWEGNTFGSFVAATLVATLGWRLASKRWLKGRMVVNVALAVMAVGLVLSLSRGAWLGAVAGLVVVLVYLGRWRLLIAGALVGAALFTMAAAQACQATDGPLSPVTQRLVRIVAPLQGTLDATTTERFLFYRLALAEWLERPIIGWGAGSFGQMHRYVSVDEPAWVDNLEIHALHDSGIIGLVGLLMAVVGTPVAVLLQARHDRKEDDDEVGTLVGLGGGCAALLVAFQATEATLLGYPWYILGLTWAAGRSRPATSAHGTDVHGCREGPGQCG